MVLATSRHGLAELVQNRILSLDEMELVFGVNPEQPVAE